METQSEAGRDAGPRSGRLVAGHRARASPRYGALLLGLVLAPGPAVGGVLDVPLIPQVGALWCWAASAEMVLDFLEEDAASQAAVGQCTLARRLPDSFCDCKPPDGFCRNDSRCDQPTPFGSREFVPRLLPGVTRTNQALGHRPPLDRDLLACEIDRRGRPVIAWWLVKDLTCHQRGSHLVVVSGFEPGTPRGDLVLVLDPQPVRAGDRYWLTWRGFACGFRLGGHCVDYYDIRESPTELTCAKPNGELDDFECGKTAPEEFEKIYELPQAEAAVTGLLESSHGPVLRSGLDVPPEAGEIVCDRQIRVRGARLMLSGADLPILTPVGTTRLLCELGGEGAGSPASIFLFDRDEGGWLLAGFGGDRTTAWLRQGARELLRAAAPEGADEVPTPAAPAELFEVVIPGTGDRLLILPRGGEADLAVRFNAPVERPPLPLGDVLQDLVAGESSPTLESWIRDLPWED